jgi:hypothetical protein
VISKTVAALANNGCTAAHSSDDRMRAILSTSGCIPLVELVQLPNELLVPSQLVNDVVFRRAGDRKPNCTRPVDISISDGEGSPLLTLIFGMRFRDRSHAFAEKLSTRPDLLKTVDLFAADTNGRCAIDVLSNTPSHFRFYHAVAGELLMLQQRLLAAWQAELGPLLRSVWSSLPLEERSDKSD